MDQVLVVLLLNTPCSYKQGTQCDPNSRVTDTASFQPWKHQLRGSQLDNLDTRLALDLTFATRSPTRSAVCLATRFPTRCASQAFADTSQSSQQRCAQLQLSPCFRASLQSRASELPARPMSARLAAATHCPASSASPNLAPANSSAAATPPMANEARMHFRRCGVIRRRAASLLGLASVELLVSLSCLFKFEHASRSC